MMFIIFNGNRLGRKWIQFAKIDRQGRFLMETQKLLQDGTLEELGGCLLFELLCGQRFFKGPREQVFGEIACAGANGINLAKQGAP